MDNSEVIFDLINFNIEGVDVYHHNGSLWLIFTDDKKWVIELTKDGTLWYNYYFFTNCFKYLSLDVVNNQHYITKWVENVIQNGVKQTAADSWFADIEVEDIIQNGVTHTLRNYNSHRNRLEDTIENGVIITVHIKDNFTSSVEHVIQNGIRNTIRQDITQLSEVEDVIQNGVKDVTAGKTERLTMINETIQNGVKEIKTNDSYRNYFKQNNKTEKVIENGVKIIKPAFKYECNPIDFKFIKQEETRYYAVKDVVDFGIKKTLPDNLFDTSVVEYIIENGVNEVIPLPAQDGNRDWGVYYQRQGDVLKPHVKYVDDAINLGIKKTI
jgi:hypothetical protein